MGKLTYTAGMDHLDTESGAFDGWDFRFGGSSASTQTLLAVSDDEAHVEHLSVGNFVWQTRQVGSKSGMRQLETRRGRVAELRECREGEFVALVEFGADLQIVDAREVVTTIATAADGWAFEPAPKMARSARTQTRWVDVVEEEAEQIDSTSDLTFEKIEGRGSRKTVNAFLNGNEDGTVDHSQGGVHHWKAAFVARHEGEIVAALVLAPPQNGVVAAEGKEIVISRIACHPTRPKNTSSWMISRARKWAERAGYSRVSSLAGVDGNRGTTYAGAGFTLDSVVEDYQDGNGDLWAKRRYVYELNPEKYEGRDVPMPGEAAAQATA